MGIELQTIYCNQEIRIDSQVTHEKVLKYW